MSKDQKNPKTNRGRRARSSRYFPSALAQQHQGPSSYLRFLHLNDPGGWDNYSSMSPQGTRFLDVMQHEAGHLIVKLKRETHQGTSLNQSRVAVRRDQYMSPQGCLHAHLRSHVHMHKHAYAVHTYLGHRNLQRINTHFKISSL